ncbi:MAG: DUF393 domain-containing protein [Gammaproteobacteria bacterium]|nr:DUF393 domain-containing protein [Gammaproteobacteria bacterium]
MESHPLAGRKASVRSDFAHGTRVVVFYDGGCPVCRREIAHYRHLDRQRRLDWHDICAQPEALEHVGLTFEQAMRRFHVVDPEGVLRSGAEAFIVVWQQLPGWRWLARAVRMLRMTFVLEWGYGHWAERRWRRLQYCDVKR